MSMVLIGRLLLECAEWVHFGLVILTWNSVHPSGVYTERGVVFRRGARSVPELRSTSADTLRRKIALGVNICDGLMAISGWNQQ